MLIYAQILIPVALIIVIIYFIIQDIKDVEEFLGEDFNKIEGFFIKVKYYLYMVIILAIYASIANITML